MGEPETKLGTVLRSAWQSPSNIAIIKYWGKRGRQLPANASLSFSLSRSCTHTSISLSYGTEDAGTVGFLLDGRREAGFEARIGAYIQFLLPELPFLEGASLRIESRNTFPHSAGIASSASGFSALALCLVSLEEKATGIKNSVEDFFRKASHLARLGSGSACRSVYPGYTVWGNEPVIPGSSDQFAIPVNDSIHGSFMQLHDAILLVDAGPKEVSSTQGHSLMDRHPFATARYMQASENLRLLMGALSDGDFSTFANVAENEAMTLHSLMMSSVPWFSLLRENTWQILKKIKHLREHYRLEVCFTLDAGPNVHMLYASKHQKDVEEYMVNELLQHCTGGSHIDDGVGMGPVEITDRTDEN
jgi:diphosphomevalonate decarboxylase